jgi:light-regulated signal transduction histidine kinase (bacteriophytochrome)
MTYQDITHPDDLDADVESAGRLLTGEIDHYRMEKRFVHKQGHAVWALLAVSLVHDDTGAPLVFVAQATDISALKEAEHALVSHTTELERSNAELEQLAYVASHDLQQPLRVVTSYAELLAERYQGRLDERADRWIGYVMDGVDHMRSMIDALLALARVNTDGQGFERVAVGAIIDRVWQQLLERQTERDARLTCDALPTLAADEAQIEQLFQNLLGNAFKYSRPGIPLRVHVSAARTADGPAAMWEFAIHDNGIGLDMAHAGRIFQIFQRLHRDDEFEGTGIGLAICKRIVERHGGHIWVESTLGEGATFRFTILERGE